MQNILEIARLNQLRDANETAMISEAEREANAKGIAWKLKEVARKTIQEIERNAGI